MTAAVRVAAALFLLLGCGDQTSPPPAVDAGTGMDADAERTDAGTGSPVGWRLGSGRSEFPRAIRNAVLLDSGRIVVAGGDVFDILWMTVEEYDPFADSWDTVVLLRPIRVANNSGTPLSDGRMLITAGGIDDGFHHPANSANAETYLYDPVARTAPLGGALGEARSHHAAILLEDGTVLVVGGAGRTGDLPDTMPVALGSCERFDPVAEAWSPAGSLAVPRWAHTATRLPDGRVLVAGGTDESGVPVARVEVYDPAADAWNPAGTLAAGRAWHVAAVLASGRVLVAGGLVGRDAATATVEIWDPASGAFEDAEPLPRAVADAAVTVLDDHRVLVTGGVPDGTLEPVGQAAIFDDRTGRWTEMRALEVPRFGHSALRLEDGRVVVVLGRTGVTTAEDRVEISEEPP